MKNPEKVKEGKYYKRAGMLFENVVRADLEKKGWIVDRWSNQVDLTGSEIIKERNKIKELQPVGKLVKAKSNRFNMRTTGFPDFVIFKLIAGELYDVHGVEVKSNGKLSKIEKEKCVWLLENNIFSKIFIASKGGVTETLIYEEFK